MKAVTLFCLALALTLTAVVTVRAQQSVLVLVEVVAKPGKQAQVLAAFKRSQAQCAQWPGCRRFETAVSAENNHHIVLVELWDSWNGHV